MQQHIVRTLFHINFRCGVPGDALRSPVSKCYLFILIHHIHAIIEAVKKRFVKSLVHHKGGPFLNTFPFRKSIILFYADGLEGVKDILDFLAYAQIPAMMVF